MKRNYAVLALLVVSMVVLLSGTSSALNYLEYNDTANNPTSVGDVQWRGQTFMWNYTTDILTRVSLFINGTVSGQNLTIMIQNVTAGVPNGQNITFLYTNGATLNSTTDFVDLYSVNGKGLMYFGQNYSIIFAHAGGLLVDAVSGHNPGSYSFGNAVLTSDAGTSWTPNTAIDFMFRVYGNTSGSSFSISPTLLYPISGTTTSNNSILFNSTASISGGNLSNATLYIWNQTTNTIFNTTSIFVNPLSNTTYFNVSNFGGGFFLWNVLWCGNNATYSECDFAPTNFSFITGLTFNSNTSNLSSYETDYQSFSINVSSNIGVNITSANLIYNRSSYSANISQFINNFVLTKSIDIPKGSGASNWFFQLFFSNGAIVNSTANVQSTTPINYSYCSVAPQNNSYINFTFKDEISGANINATLDSSSWIYYLGTGTVNSTLTYTNLVTNISYAFCFNPQNKSLTTYLSNLKYSNTNYPQRIYSPGFINLSSTTTNQVLYLLSSSAGIYSSIQVLQSLGTTPIAGASITVELLQSSGSYAPVGYATSDSSGIATFWVNPNSNYRYTVSAAGYLSTQFSLTPSQSVYYARLFTLGSSTTAYNSSLQGYKWYVLPQIGTLNATSNTFTLNLTSYANNLYSCRFTILDSNQNTLNTTTGGSSTGCLLTITYTGSDDQRVYGRLEINNSYTLGLFQTVDTDWGWITIDNQASSWSNIESFFAQLTTLSDFGNTSYKRDFSRIMMFFLISTIFMALFAFLTGFDIQSPGSMMVVIWFILAFGSLGNFLQVNSISPNLPSWFKTYIILIIYTLFLFGYLFKLIKRQG